MPHDAFRTPQAGELDGPASIGDVDDLQRSGEDDWLAKMRVALATNAAADD
jgi:hypothetical protein